MQLSLLERQRLEREEIFKTLTRRARRMVKRRAEARRMVKSPSIMGNTAAEGGVAFPEISQHKTICISRMQQDSAETLTYTNQYHDPVHNPNRNAVARAEHICAPTPSIHGSVDLILPQLPEPALSHVELLAFAATFEMAPQTTATSLTSAFLLGFTWAASQSIVARQL